MSTGGVSTRSLSCWYDCTLRLSDSLFVSALCNFLEILSVPFSGTELTEPLAKLCSTGDHICEALHLTTPATCSPPENADFALMHHPGTPNRLIPIDPTGRVPYPPAALLETSQSTVL